MLDGSEPEEDFKPEQLSFLAPLDLHQLIIQQSMLCTEAQCLFVDALFESIKIMPMEAYERAGYACANKNAAIAGSSRLKRLKQVARLIALRREQIRKASCINASLLISHQVYLMEESSKAKEYGTSSKIGIEVGKLCGIYRKIEKNNEDLENDNNCFDSNDVSDEEWSAIIDANALSVEKENTLKEGKNK